MKVAYFDCSAGAAGDMVLGALLDLGLSIDGLRAELGKLALGPYEIAARPVERCGLRATKLSVVIGGDEVPGVEAEHPHVHAHDHDHGHAHDHAHGKSAAEIARLIESSGLGATVKARALGLFRRL